MTFHQGQELATEAFAYLIQIPQSVQTSDKMQENKRPGQKNMDLQPMGKRKPSQNQNRVSGEECKTEG